jgi:hypothetical protein
MTKSELLIEIERLYDRAEDIYLDEAKKYYTGPSRHNVISFDLWEKISGLIDDAHDLIMRDLEIERKDHHMQDMADSCFNPETKL